MDGWMDGWQPQLCTFVITIGVGILNVLFLNTSSLTGSKTVVTLNYIGYVTFASSNIALFMLLGICCAIHRYDIEDLCTRTKYVPCHLDALRSRRLTPTDRAIALLPQEPRTASTGSRSHTSIRCTFSSTRPSTRPRVSCAFRSPSSRLSRSACCSW